MKHLFFFLIVLCYQNIAYAEVQYLSVLEFRGVDVNSDILLNLSDQVRSAAIATVPNDQYQVMTRENMLQILEDMGRDASCMEGSCEIDVGRNIGADIIITGDIIQLQDIYILNLKLYQTSTGSLLSIQEVEAENLYQLKKNTYAQSLSMFQKTLGGHNDNQTTKKNRLARVFPSATSKTIMTALCLGAVSGYGLTGLTYYQYQSEPDEAIFQRNNQVHNAALGLTGLSLGYLSYRIYDTRKTVSLKKGEQK